MNAALSLLLFAKEFAKVIAGGAQAFRFENYYEQSPKLLQIAQFSRPTRELVACGPKLDPQGCGDTFMHGL
jgi:hypothetical protein